MPSRKAVKASASDLRRVVHIQHDTSTDDGQGGHTPNWVDVPGLSNVPLQFLTWSPYVQFQYQQQYPGVNSRAVMRYRRSATVNAGMRAVYGNHIYKIHGAMNYDEDNAAILLLLEELQATGTNRS